MPGMVLGFERDNAHSKRNGRRARNQQQQQEQEEQEELRNGLKNVVLADLVVMVTSN
jgi:hypothetical protein